jgi:hypothetical protein
MAITTLVLAHSRLTPRARVRARPRRVPFEAIVIFVVAAAFYLAVGAFLVFHMHYMIDDAYARIDNAFDVLFTSDPHLAGIGFFWPPLPSFLELPIIAFRNLWPPLVTQAFAGTIEAALFGAGTLVLLNSGLKWAGVVRPMRWVICLVWLSNPMTIIYAAQGMSETPFIFFFFASILVFLRWSESNRTALLPLMGVLAGLGCLCRNEAFLTTALIGVGVIALSIRRRAGVQEIENAALLYGLPAIFVVLLWVGSAAVIFHDPLYWFHANGINIFGKGSSGAVAAAAAAGTTVTRSTAYGVVTQKGVFSSSAFILGHSLALFPGVVAMLGMLGVRLITRGNRLAAIMLVSFGLSIPVLDMLIIQSGLGPYLRYQISVIPFAFLVGVFVLRAAQGRRAIVSPFVALAVTLVLGLSNIGTAETLADPALGVQEAPLLTALSSGKTVPEATGVRDKIDIGAAITPQILALDRDGGRILCDSSTCFPIVLNAPDPKLFVVTSDRTFQAAVAAPQSYGIEYFLVPALTGQGAFDYVNVQYPTLWENGAGFSTLVGGVDGDPMGQWRLYRITGPTGAA